MKLPTARLCSNVVRGLALAAIGPLLYMGLADAQVRPVPAAMHIRSGHPTRALEMARRPRHIRTAFIRADSRGDTASSTRYYSITNVTAEVHGHTGFRQRRQ